MSGKLYAGCARTVITPPVGLELAGYGPYHQRASTSVQDDLYATVLVLAQDDQRVALVSLDLCGVSAALTRRIRSLVPPRTGLARHQIMVSCTHTHSGPATLFLRGWGAMSADYLALLPLHIARAVDSAVMAARPVEVTFGRDRVDGVAVNRATPDGPVRPELEVVGLEADDGPVAMLFNYGCRPVVSEPTSTAIGRDWVGPVIEAFEAAQVGCCALFLQGAAGDLDPALAHTGQTAATAGAISAAVDRAWAARQPVPAPRLRWATSHLPLPLAPTPRAAVLAVPPVAGDADTPAARFEREWAAAELARLDGEAPEVWDTELQALALSDDLALVFCGGEVFTAVGQQVRAASPYRETLFVGYTNDLVGCIPDRADYERGGYSAVQVPRILDNYPFRPDVGDVLSEAMVRLLTRLRTED